MSIEITRQLVQETNEQVFHYFKEISKIPRGSHNEKAIADWIVDFALKRNLEIRRTEASETGQSVYNVVICKPATPGYESVAPVILQAHIDMVCQKTKESQHNFLTDPIEIVSDGKYMTAKGTTLGADDGIGVACILAILDSHVLAHPPIEALFTSDEEDGMSGAMAVTDKLVTAKRLINIDTEHASTLYYGCAGGIDANFTLPATYEPIAENAAQIKITLSGLLGGHSGVEIHRKHANAHKLMARTLRAVQDVYPFSLIAFEGGDKRNVITREACALISVEPRHADSVRALIKSQEAIFQHEYAGTENAINLTAETVAESHTQVLSQQSLNKFIAAILIIPNDIQAMHCNEPSLVETSCNLGIVSLKPDGIRLCSLIRSFFRTKKLYVLEQMRQLATLLGAEFTATGDYPDWEPKRESEIIARFVHAYQTAFSAKPTLESIHAGLECGYFTEKFPWMEMIACGPTITGAHTPEERLDIESTEKVVELLLQVLNQMDEAAPVREMNNFCAEDRAHTHTHVCQCIR